MLYWRIVATGNGRDRSSQTGVYVERNVSSRITLFALATLNAGRADSEYGALLHAVATLGVKLIVF